MKKIVLVLVLGLLLSGNVYPESSWFEIKDKNNTSKHWNLNKAEGISKEKVFFIGLDKSTIEVINMFN